MEIVQPKFNVDAFSCPHCGTFSKMNWSRVVHEVNRMLYAASCDRCKSYSLWLNGKHIYPPVALVEEANSDLPEELSNLYDEAAAILATSPRASAALLRLVIDKLTIHLGAQGRDLNMRIAGLVNKGLRPMIQQSLDIVRVVGNNAVHPGEINFKDDDETARALFRLINLIVQEMITDPREASELFDSLPSSAKDAIEKRDQKSL